ncbi:hypothetical protein EVAR_24374_1 [Eumeta japonica]|uniref:Uncharacterized protein n=1 Tax=Eumeta variegata TaxID=151549 RepID=A0A4C1YAT0_EUMVA|nr:hypothetical protein EVAR_24374_1 [Eumeta japonica]
MSDIWIRRWRFGSAQCSIAEAASACKISSNTFACTAYCRGFITDERPRINRWKVIPAQLVGATKQEEQRGCDDGFNLWHDRRGRVLAGSGVCAMRDKLDSRHIRYLPHCGDERFLEL